ncbi:hypothetical protein KAOT1_12042 [Kordia algicida OT-1]|uniref:Uncharacterized protein n=2 Tax=Kordia TaxID=221065 RepID=A9DIP0_9FLAO|nr:hypothetical protein KAOT1_12042 [Kordia algicida OT-1]
MLIAAFVLIVSCEEEAKSTKNATKKVKETATTKVEPTNLSKDKEQMLATTIAYFKNCKANAETRNDCRNSITKMISEFYTIDDFKNENNEYVIYDSIQPIIKKSDTWVQLGNANDQEALNKAQQAANDGKATLAIDVSESYGQVAMIIPGKLTNSGSWKLKVPNAAALVNYSADKSFMDKSLSYAFKSTENIVLFSKN